MLSLFENRFNNEKPLYSTYNKRQSLYEFATYQSNKRPINKSQIEVNPSIKITVPENARQFNTHKYIVKSAIDVLLSDMHHSYLQVVDTPSKKLAVKEFFNENIRKIYLGSIEPDICENDLFMGIPTFEGHFYDPDTGKNFRGNSVPTAYSRFVDHSTKAKKMFEEKNPDFALELGRALHYLCDAGEPHHSSNKIAFLSNHLPFEKYAKMIKDSAKITSGEFYYSFQPVNLQEDSNFKRYCEKIITYTAHFSKKYSDIDNIKFTYADNYAKSNKSFREITLGNIDSKQLRLLDKTVIENIENCQNITSGFLYNFLRATKII